MNCYRGRLIEYLETPELIIYTFKPKGEECLFDQFIGKFETDAVYRVDLNIMLAAVRELTRRGIDHRRFFRKKGEGPIDALLPGTSDLRLYCVPYGKNAIVIGNGDIKKALKVQDCPNCGPHWKFLTVLDAEIQNRIISGDIIWQERDGKRKLTGELYFEIGNCE